MMYNIKISSIEGNCTEISSKEINNICRACLKQNGIINMFEMKHDGLLFRDLFTLFSLFHAEEEDGFPQKICQQCADLINKLYSFKQLVAENQLILQLASSNLKASELSEDNFTVKKRTEPCENDSDVFNIDLFNGNENIEIIDDSSIKQEIETKNTGLSLDHDYSKCMNASRFSCPCCFLTFNHRGEFISHRMQEAKKAKLNEIQKDFSCLYCNLKFNTRSDFMIHMKNKSEGEKSEIKEEYTCPKCNIKFHGRCEFLRHRKQERDSMAPRKREFICKHCNLKFNSQREYMRHRRSELEYTCSNCNLKFNSRTEWILHRKKEAKKKPNNLIYAEFTCPYCKLKFNSRAEYMKHRKEEAKKKSMCPYCRKIMHTSLFDNHLRLRHKKLPPLKCEFCKKRFLLSKLFDKHLLGHKEGFFCEICGRKCLTETALNCHKRSHLVRKECNTCNKTFKNPYLYRDHMYKHTGAKPYLCSVCGARFNSQANLYNHNYQKHVDRPLKCRLCGNGFKTDKKLKEHLQRHEQECNICGQYFTKKSSLVVHLKTHNDKDERENVVKISKKYPGKKEKVKCLSCSKEFSSSVKVNFQLHIRSHLGESPYLCLFCGEQFQLENQYDDHKELHANKKLEKLYKCQVCSRIHGSNAALKSHMRFHTGEKPFQCTACGKHFYTKTHLKTHMLWHTGERSFSCTICGKTFATKGNCLQHERTHTGQGSYACNLCGKIFRSESSIRKHSQIHNKIVLGHNMNNVNTTRDTV